MIRDALNNRFNSKMPSGRVLAAARADVKVSHSVLCLTMYYMYLYLLHLRDRSLKKCRPLEVPPLAEKHSLDFGPLDCGNANAL